MMRGTTRSICSVIQSHLAGPVPFTAHVQWTDGTQDNLAIVEALSDGLLAFSVVDKTQTVDIYPFATMRELSVLPD